MTATMKTVLVPLVVWLVRIVVTVYTIITLPLYYLIQMPWRRLKRAKSCGAHLVNKGRLSDSAPIDKVGVNFLEYEVTRNYFFSFKTTSHDKCPLTITFV